MSCARHADAILEHALGESATAELFAHLQDCADCRAALERERALVGAIDGGLREALALTPGPSLKPRIRAAVADRKSAGPAWSLLRLLPVAAAVAAAITLALLRQPKTSESQPQLARPMAASSVQPSPSGAPSTLPSAPPVASRTVRNPRAQQPSRASVRLEPEVLVVPGEAELVRRFVVTLQARGIAERSALVARTEAASAELSVPPLEEMPLLDVKPLTSADPKETIHD